MQKVTAWAQGRERPDRSQRKLCFLAWTCATENNSSWNRRQSCSVSRVLKSAQLSTNATLWSVKEIQCMRTCLHTMWQCVACYTISMWTQLYVPGGGCWMEPWISSQGFCPVSLSPSSANRPFFCAFSHGGSSSHSFPFTWHRVPPSNKQRLLISSWTLDISSNLLSSERHGNPQA